MAAAIPEIDGRPAFRPSRAATLMVAVGLFAAAYVIALVGHIVGGPLWRAPRFLAFGLTLRFLARALGDFRLVGFSKRVRSSRFARLDTAFYSPLCLCLALGLATSPIGTSNFVLNELIQRCCAAPLFGLRWRLKITDSMRRALPLPLEFSVKWELNLERKDVEAAELYGIVVGSIGNWRHC